MWVKKFTVFLSHHKGEIGGIKVFCSRLSSRSFLKIIKIKKREVVFLIGVFMRAS